MIMFLRFAADSFSANRAPAGKGEPVFAGHFFVMALLLVSILAAQPSSVVAQPVQELRGIWITNVDSDVLESKESIAEAIDFLADAGFNIVFPVVWNKAQTLYPSPEMNRRFGIPIDPLFAGRDPLRELTVEAHRNGMEVVPWFEFGFSSSYNEGGGHLLAAHPEWMGRDVEGNLLKKNNFEWMNAFDPEVQDFLTALLVEVAKEYDVDGVQGDDRLPALPSQGGYDEQTVARFVKAFGKQPPPYHQNSQWLQWRADILTDYLASIRWRIHRIDPNLMISVSPSIYDWGLREYLQDLRTWTQVGLYDIAHPQAYRYNLPAYRSLIDQMVEFQFEASDLPRLSPGILIKSGDYRIETQFLLDSIAYNRSRGINGEVLFFYEGLRLNDDELGRALKEGPYAAPARLPHRNGKVWRPGGVITPLEEVTLEGGWEPVPDRAGFVRLAQGVEGSLVTDVTVPRTGHYDIYVEFPKGDGHAARATFELTSFGAEADSEKVIVDLSGPNSAGWTLVGQVHLLSGANKGVLSVAGPVAEGALVAGPVMALLNRRASPDVEWPE